jgi:hypothetical protein
MAYHVEIDEALVLAYLRSPERGLAEADVDVLLDFLEGLARTGEAYRNEPSRRCSPGSTHFEVTYIFEDSAGRIRTFRFIISDAAAAYGVLRVRFTEEL